MSAIVYPASLPPPSVPLSSQAAERRLLGEPPGPFDARAVQRDRLAIEDAVFLLRAVEAEIFDTWYRERLRDGGAWFAATWPLPQGMVVGVRQFIVAPRWQNLGAGNWRVEAKFQVRGRGMLPLDPDLALFFTSWPYPVVFIEELDFGHGVPMAGQLWVPPTEELNFGHGVPVSGTLPTILVSYDQPAEQLDFPHATPFSGTLDVVLVTYDQPAEQLDINNGVPVSGTLVSVLVSYSAPAEQIDFGNLSPISGTLA